MTAHVEYWEECLAESLDEHGIIATAEQIKDIAEDVAGAHTVMGENLDPPVMGPSSHNLELDRLNKELANEKSKVVCRECAGTGRITEYIGPWFSNSQCDRCDGAGRHLP